MPTTIKHSYYYLVTLIVFVIPYISYALINELYQLKQNLHILEKFISQPHIKLPMLKATTYKILYNVAQEAYIKKNLDILDRFEKSIAVTTTKYLIEEFLKEGNLTEHETLQYIPFIAYIAQQVTEQYPDKNTNLHCVLIAYGDLTHEFLLVRALRYIGYKTIQLISISDTYNDTIKNTLQTNFKTWCERYNISVSFGPDQAHDGVNLALYQIGYDYIQKVNQNKLTKNHLFLMIKNIYYTMVVHEAKNTAKATTDINLLVKKIIPNYLMLEEKGEGSKLKIIKIYLPYKLSEFWIVSNTMDNKIKNIQKFIQGWLDTPLYQKNLIINVINNFFDTSVLNSFSVGNNENLFYFDLLKHTAINPAKPFAFRIDFKQVNQIIGDMSESLQNIFSRAHNQNFKKV